MGITLHPFVAVPFALGIRYLIQVCSNLFAKKEKNTHQNEEKGNLSITMILFLAFLILNQLYLFNNWMNFREEIITEKCQTPPQNVTLEECQNSFGAYSDFGSLIFDQCNCTKQFDLTGENVCINTDPVYNIENFLDIISSKATSYLLLAYALLMILFHIVECSTPCLPTSIPLDIFVLGPSFQQRMNEHHGPYKINEYSSSIIKVSTFKRTRNYIKSVLYKIDVLYLVVAIVSIVAIYCSIFSFEGFYSWKQFRCNPGFYDALPDPDILMCLSKFIR